MICYYYLNININQYNYTLTDQNGTESEIFGVDHIWSDIKL